MIVFSFCHHVTFYIKKHSCQLISWYKVLYVGSLKTRGSLGGGICGTGQLQAGWDRENRASTPPSAPPVRSRLVCLLFGGEEQRCWISSQPAEPDFTKDNSMRNSAGAHTSDGTDQGRGGRGDQVRRL